MLRGIAVRPAPGILERLWQVPVIKRWERTDLRFEQFIDETLVEVEAFVVGFARAGWLDARPCDREAAALDVELAHDRDVFLVAVIVIVGHISGITVLGLSRR